MRKSKGRDITLDDVDPNERYLTEKEVAAIVGISASTLQKHRMDNVGLPYIRYNGTIRYQQSVVHREMQSHRIETADSRAGGGGR